MAFGFAKLAKTISPNGDTYPEQAKHPDILFNSFCKCFISSHKWVLTNLSPALD